MTNAPPTWLGADPLVRALLARCTFDPPGAVVTCAVSGGADSTALVVLAVASGCRATAVHVDHGLRDGSAGDAAVVARTCARLGVELRCETVHVGQGPNLEARARAARFGVLPATVLTGHTADDQAETVLINLMRGASTGGLAAMRPGPRRPILGLRRTDTHALCVALGLAVVTDETNDDQRFLRNRIRHHLLPELSAAAGRDLVPVLVRQAALMGDDHDLLDQLAAAIDATDAVALAAAPVALARRAVRRWLTESATQGFPPDLATVERVLAVARGEAVACDTTGGRRVIRSRQRLSIIAGHQSPS